MLQKKVRINIPLTIFFFEKACRAIFSSYDVIYTYMMVALYDFHCTIFPIFYNTVANAGVSIVELEDAKQ